LIGTRCLIVTGDDFGVSSEVNQAIIQAHEQGILTSASLMVTGAACDEAVRLASRHPNLAVGLHLVLVHGQSALPPQQIPHLVDESGRFSRSPLQAGLRYQFSRAARRELRREIRAQLERFKRTGLRLAHVDGHLHLHMHPVVLETLVDCAEEFGIRAIRLPKEELGVNLQLDRRRLLTQVVYTWLFGRLRRFGESRLRPAGIEFADRVYGLLQTGRITEDYLLKLIPRISAGRVEIYSHPTLLPEMDNPRGASRLQLEALLSGRVRAALEAHGFHLTSYQDVVLDQS